MRCEGYRIYFVRGVRLFVCYHLTTRNETTNQRYQWVYSYTGLIFKKAIFIKGTAFESYGVKSK